MLVEVFSGDMQFFLRNYLDACSSGVDVDVAELCVLVQYTFETGVSLECLGCYCSGRVGEYRGSVVYLWGQNNHLIAEVSF